MSAAPAVSLAFFDTARRRYGTARAGVTLLFEDRTPIAIAQGPEIAERDGGYRAWLEGRLELELSPLCEPVSLAGERSRVCHVSGTVEGSAIDCLGTMTETLTPPVWAELDASRAVSAIFTEGHTVLARARRPRGALGHGQELVSAAMIAAGDAVGVEDARISTVYDGDGRQRSAGVELWLPGEDFPRRLSGEVIAGTTLELPGLEVNAAVFAWRMDAREGVGAYDVTVRSEPPAAA